MNNNKKQGIIISSIIAAMFIVPLVVFAVLYHSNERENNFHPAEAEIQVREGEETGGALIDTDSYTWVADNSNYKVDKPVQIYDVRDKNDEYLRVRFVPMWCDADGNIVGGYENFSDYSTVSRAGNELQFKNASGTTLLTLSLYTAPDNPKENWDNYWIYDASKQCFYYDGTIKSGDISGTLLSGAKIPQSVYDETTDYTLHIEVLADAVQTSGDAKDDRW